MREGKKQVEPVKELDELVEKNAARLREAFRV
jgi:hypothetical protein